MSPNIRRLVRGLAVTYLAFFPLLVALFPDELRLIPPHTPSIVSDNRNQLPSARSSSKDVEQSSRWPTAALVVLYGIGIISLFAMFYTEVSETPNDPGPLNSTNFLNQYVDCLGSTQRLISRVSVLNETEREKLIVGTLVNICTVTELYNNDNADHKQRINACLYVPFEYTNAPRKYLDTAKEYIDPARTSYSHILVLTHWAHEKGDSPTESSQNAEVSCVDTGFSLPVDTDKQHVLPGAPLAFLTGQPNLVADVTDKRKIEGLLRYSPPKVRRHAVGFFLVRESYRSFVSVPIRQDAHIVGIVCIQSALPSFLRLDRNDGKNVMKAIDPFLSALAVILTAPKMVTPNATPPRL